MVNEWLRRQEKLPQEPFPEQVVIELPRYRRIAPRNLARVDKIGFARPQIKTADIGGRLG
jgi:hypothetical protein